ncbi:single-stranded DNA-binding protein [Halomonas sp. QX-2]|uniref:Single-stranded DNA-binding protein n=1 Tax=Vreelandella sedimenti TaxID=2729618 RepID=A0A7Z0SPQ7_9GAMM|nr:single-stranded DNA-binding protein [Halomonas sedimenti]NYT74211.1 single-stranded DNA-binding protein [Halomonas sedimenti]
MGVYATVARIGRNAEVRKTGNGTSVAGFAAAVDVGFGEHKQTLWLDCSLWGKRAEGGLIQYLVKGQQVFVSGEIGTRQFNKGDGSQGFAVTLKIAEIDLVGGKGQNGGGQSQGYGNQQNQAPQGGYQQQPPQNQRAQQHPDNTGYGAPPQNQQPPQNYGAPDYSNFDDFDDEIPF